MPDNYNLEIRFLDTMRFMAESLESLANNLTDTDLNTVKSQFKTKKEFDLVRKKEFFLIIALTRLKNLLKHSFHLEMISLTNLMIKNVRLRIMSTRKRFGLHLIVQLCKNIWSYI